MAERIQAVCIYVCAGLEGGDANNSDYCATAPENLNFLCRRRADTAVGERRSLRLDVLAYFLTRTMVFRQG